VNEVFLRRAKPWGRALEILQFRRFVYVMYALVDPAPTPMTY
jgi:hypothetical protein